MSVEWAEPWREEVIPGTVLAVVFERGPQKFSPNVVVTITRGVATTWGEAEAAVEEFVSTLTEVEVVPRERALFSAVPWSVVQFAHVSAAAGTVFQIVCDHAGSPRPVVDTVRVTATCDADGVEEFLPELRRIVASVEIDARS